MSESKCRGNWLLGFCGRAMKRDDQPRCKHWDDEKKCEGCLHFSNYEGEEVNAKIED